MRVESSNISLSATHALTASRKKTEKLTVWDNRASLSSRVNSAVTSYERSASKDSGEDDELTLSGKWLILARLVASLTGHEIKILSGKAVSSGAGGTASQVPSETTGNRGGTQGWGLTYTSTETYVETEQTSFEANGVVTANGKDYALSLSLEMDRSFTRTENTDIRAGDALKDPLVVNLGAGPATLSGQKMKFDIDVDGTEEDVPLLGGQNGFLALDKNGNGTIDNGSELFGPATGNGYGELAAYDEDHNGWIDEGDSVYSRLGVWTKGTETETLRTLKDLDIGALYTGTASTPFELKNAQNQTEAKIMETSLYLREDGSAGTTQRMDVAV